MTILGIDTSNKALGIVLGTKEEVYATYYSKVNKNHSDTLMPAINFLFAENKVTPNQVTGIVIAKGPGSYTGLRIGVTTAKTLSWTLNVPLYAVSSLEVIAANTSKTTGLIVPFMDARRSHVYSGAYRWENNKLISVIEDGYYELSSWLEKLAMLNEEVNLITEEVGQLVDILAPYLENKNIELEIKDANPANLLLFLTEEKIVSDIHEFTPTYLKRVEAEEKWMDANKLTKVDSTSFVERVDK